MNYRTLLMTDFNPDIDPNNPRYTQQWTAGSARRCLDCGSLVWNIDRHDSWHNQIDHATGWVETEREYRWEQRDRGL